MLDLMDVPGDTLTKADLKVYLGPIPSAIDDMRTDMNRRFDEVDRRFEQVDRRFEQVETHFEQLERRFDGRFEQLTNRFDSRLELIENRTGAMDHRLSQRIDRIWLTLTGGLLAVVAALLALITFG